MELTKTDIAMKLLPLTLLLFTIVLCSSCRKCYDCEATDTTTGQVWDSETVCSSEERDNYESTMTDPTIDSYATCTQL